MRVESALARDLNRDHLWPHLTWYWRVVQVDLRGGDEPALGQGRGEFLGEQVGHAARQGPTLRCRAVQSGERHKQA